MTYWGLVSIRVEEKHKTEIFLRERKIGVRKTGNNILVSNCFNNVKK